MRARAGRESVAAEVTFCFSGVIPGRAQREPGIQ